MGAGFAETSMDEPIALEKSTLEEESLGTTSSHVIFGYGLAFVF